MDKNHEQKKQINTLFTGKTSLDFTLKHCLQRGTITKGWWLIQQVLIMLSVHPPFYNILRCPVTYCNISPFFFSYSIIQLHFFLMWTEAFFNGFWTSVDSGRKFNTDDKKKVNVFVASLTLFPYEAPAPGLISVFYCLQCTDTNVHHDIEDKHKLSCKKRQFYSLSINPYIFVKKNIYPWIKTILLVQWEAIKSIWKWH